MQKFNVWSIIEAHKYCRVGVESIDVEFPNCVEVWSSLGSCNGDLAEAQCRPQHHRQAGFYTHFLGSSVWKSEDDDAWIEKRESFSRWLDRALLHSVSLVILQDGF